MRGLHLSFIGGGNMAQSMISGLINNGIEPALITVGEPDTTRGKKLVADFGITTFVDNVSAIKGSDMVIISVKPQIVQPIVSELSSYLIQNDTFLISIAAGIGIKHIESWIGQTLPIVRAMPNSASLVRGGITALCANSHASPKQLEQAESVMVAVGKTVWLQDENLMDIVTAISGSGPAYFFHLMEALEQAAINGGLKKEIARLLTIETALGAARLATETKDSPSTLRTKVTSPGGTTEAAMEVLNNHSTQDAIKNAVLAAKNRAQTLAKSHGDR